MDQTFWVISGSGVAASGRPGGGGRLRFSAPKLASSGLLAIGRYTENSAPRGGAPSAVGGVQCARCLRTVGAHWYPDGRSPAVADPMCGARGDSAHGPRTVERAWRYQRVRRRWTPAPATLSRPAGDGRPGRGGSAGTAPIERRDQPRLRGSKDSGAAPLVGVESGRGESGSGANALPGGSRRWWYPTRRATGVHADAVRHDAGGERTSSPPGPGTAAPVPRPVPHPPHPYEDQ